MKTREKHFLLGMVAFILALLGVLYWQGRVHAGEQTRFYGADGRSMGTATTDSQGTTTFRDARGNVTGRETAPRR